MPLGDDPLDANSVLHRKGCSCGSHNHVEHEASAQGEEAHWRRAVEGAVVRAIFPSDPQRRAFLKAVGSATAIAAISQFFPLAAATEVFASTGPIETPNLKIGFLPITCATPMILAAPMGVYAKHGLRVDLVKTPGWAVVRDKALSAEYDAAHMLSPMPLAMTLGLGAPPAPFTMPAVENVNGNAITLAIKHKDRRDPGSWKGFKLGIPFEYSMHNYLLRYYLAESGIDPDKDVQLVIVPPAKMLAGLKEGELDGFIVADPFNQRAVYDGIGFIHLLTKEIWDGHPCCAFAASREFVTSRPNTMKALLKAIIEATAYSVQPENRKQVADFIAPEHLINQPAELIEQVLTGKFNDGLGNVRDVPNRIGFDPFPWHSFAVWIMTQMKRWGQIKADVNYWDVAQQVYLATDTVKLMRESGLRPPLNSSKKFAVMGREFDPSSPDEYLASFAIRHRA
jgi:nitrate/nitrite transport system substrate-binding protein